MSWQKSAAVHALIAIVLAACATTAEHGSVSSDYSNSAELDAAESVENTELPPAAAYAVVPASKLHASMTGRRDTLRRLLATEIARSDLTPPELREDNLTLGWRSVALFANASAQLNPQALVGLSHVARWLRADGASVLQIIGRQIDTDPDELAERRVAAIAAFLIAEGAPAPRIRAQVVDISQVQSVRHSSADVADSITLIVTAIVAGREALAWVPPAAY